MRLCSAISLPSPRTLFTKAENVTMGTHYQAISVAWHDAQWLLGHCCQWLLGCVGKYVCVHVLHVCVCFCARVGEALFALFVYLVHKSGHTTFQLEKYV